MSNIQIDYLPLTIIQELERGKYSVKKRLYGLDILRIISAFMVFLFHSNMHLGCNYGFLTPFIARGDIFMVMFFMLSGFSLYYNYNNKEMLTLCDIGRFYKKRIVNVYPLYIVIYLLYLVFFNNLSLAKNILIAPYEILLLQSHFNSVFNVLHNGGTWFISCLAFSYFMYPFLQLLLKQIKRNKLKLALILYVICSAAPFVVYTFEISNIYSHPFFRTIEFFIGMIMASFFMDIDNSQFETKKLYVGGGELHNINSACYSIK